METQADGSTLAYEYDLNGNKTRLVVTPVDAAAITTSYSYDALNRLASVTSAEGITSYGYDAVGNRTSVSYPNGTSQVYGYDELNRLVSLETYDSAGALVELFDYTLHTTGRRTAITELDGRVTDYTYDPLYRLTSESITDSEAGDHSASYSYDPVGNRTSQTVNGVETVYNYDENDRLVEQGSTAYTHDQNGNTLTETVDGVTTTYSYNSKNKLVEAVTADGTSNYSYNIAGIRTSKQESGIATSFLVDSNQSYAQVLFETNGAESVSYTYGDDLISQGRAGAYSFYHYDGLGSTRLLSNAAGEFTDSYDYEAFGDLLNRSGVTENSYLYTGEQYDGGLDQYYLRARYYDQGVGRFTQMDTWGGINNQPVTLNKYLYAHADPVLNTDPSGHFIGSLTTAQSIGAILAATAVVTYQVGQVAATGGTWGDGIDLGPSSTGWLILAAMVGTNSSLLTNIADKVNEDDTSTYTLYHGTDIATARLLAGGSPIDIDGAGCNWSVSCGGFYLADQLGDAEHFAVFTQSGVRDGGVVQYNFSAAAYQIIKGIATIQPLQSAPFFNPMGNEIIVPPSGFSVFNALMLKGDIEPGPVR